MQGAEQWLPSAVPGSPAYLDTAGVSVTGSLLQKRTELGTADGFGSTNGFLYTETNEVPDSFAGAGRYLELRTANDPSYPGYSKTEATSKGRNILNLTTELRSGENRFWAGYGRNWSNTGEDTRPLVNQKLQGSGSGGWTSPGDGTLGREVLNSGILNAPTETHVAAAARDVERITKDLTTPRGLVWEAHNLENAKIQSGSRAYFGNKRDLNSQERTDLLNIAGKELIQVLTLTADTIAQVGLDGTVPGMHMTPYEFRNYYTTGAPGLAREGERIGPRGAKQESTRKLRQVTESVVPGPRSQVGANATDPNWKEIELGLVPFEIKSITPEDTFFLYFQATLGEYRDNYTGNWSSTQYVGRAENFYNYTDFSRDISFSFKAAAKSQKELKPLYEQLNMLVATTAPSYKEDVAFMRGTLVSVTIGDLLKNQIGFFRNISISWQQDYPWSIGTDTAGVKDQLIVPHLLDVSVSFVPIHDFNVSSRPQRGYFGLDSVTSDQAAGLGGYTKLVWNGSGFDYIPVLI